MTFPDAELANAFRRLMPRPIQTPQRTRVVNVPFVIGSPGTPLKGGECIVLRLGLNGPSTILTWSVVGMQNSIPASGSVTVDVLSGASFTTLSSLCGGNPPSLTAQIENNDQIPNGWTTSLPDPSCLEAIVTAVDAVLDVVGLTLRIAVGIDPNVNVVTTSDGAVVTDNSGTPVDMET